MCKEIQEEVCILPLECNVTNSPFSLCSAEIEAKYQEIMELTGVLDFGSKGKVTCNQNDLEDMGELGHGTCGQVFTMRHRDTGQIMAVKVR